MPGPGEYIHDKHILVADDDLINLMIVQHALVNGGGKVQTVQTGTAAIKMLEKQHFDLVLMDIQMPEMNGYEAAQYIRKHLHSDVPVIAMTAYALKGEEEKVLNGGMNGYFSKPFTIDLLHAAIEKVFTLTYESLHTPPYIYKDHHIVIDIGILYDVSGGDPVFINTMLRTFVQNMPATLENIRQGIALHDWDAVYKAAHHSKSSLSIVKVEKMLQEALEIEKNARKRENLESIPASFARLAEKFNLAEKVIAGQMLPV